MGYWEKLVWKHQMILRKLFLLLNFFLGKEIGAIPLVVYDDIGVRVMLARPAQRIISLAPHATELVFSLGMGQYVIGRDKASDYPKAVLNIDTVADFQQVQIDKLLALKPDLIVDWQNSVLEKHRTLLQKNNIAIFISRPQSFRAIASNMEKLGSLLGVAEKGRQQAHVLLQEVDKLQKKYQRIPRKKVYIQLSHDPLLSVSNRLFIGDMVTRCGGENIFADSVAQLPIVNVETVLAANPAVIFYTGSTADFLQRWQKYPLLTAIKNNAFIGVSSDLISRPGPRLIDAQRFICHAMDKIKSVN